MPNVQPYPFAHMYQARASIPNTTFKTLPTSPITVVPAPGSGQIVIPLYGSMIIDARAGAYTVSVDATLNLVSAGTTAYLLGPVSITSITSQASIMYLPFPANGGLTQVDEANNLAGLTTNGMVSSANITLADKALILRDNFLGVANYTGGHANNSVVINVIYVIFDMVTGLFVSP